MKEMSIEEIRKEGMAALRERLGPAGTITFLQDLGINKGNWTEERHEILGKKSMAEIVAEIKQPK
ncbi:MAG: hypothetical protein CMF59_15660 [Leptospiraceae bacterium]|nr:hypothetical protein [Leptospiraceae bacterium]MCB1139702.1 hypothetical protein [Leptospiraceae bacterium]